MNKFTATTATTAQQKAQSAAAKFHTLADAATANGGMWISAAGGTANAVAGEISRATGVTFEEAHRALDVTGGENWYEELAYQQPWPIGYIPENPRWDARVVARAACRAA